MYSRPAFCNHAAVADDDDDFMSHAADEPTAMWDGDSLAELGLDKLDPPASQEQAPPATAGKGGGGSVQIDLGPSPVGSAPPAAGRSGVMAWVITLIAAAVLGTGVFFLIRHLKGG